RRQTTTIIPPMTDPPKRKRRWYQFNLRTLMIVVTLLAVASAYVAHEHRIVKAREEARPRILDPFADLYKPDKKIAERNPAADPSFIRRWLGDRAEETHLDAYSDEQAEKLKSLFPEAEVWRCYGPAP